MGYTHYWRRPELIDQVVYHHIANDFRSLIKPMGRLGSPLAGPSGTGGPVLSAENISFNGVRDCGHRPIVWGGFGWPADDAHGVRVEREQVVVGGWGDGPLLAARTCDGCCSHDSFVFPRVMELRPRDQPLDGLYSRYCKTSFKPYDIAVTAFLVIGKHHLGPDFRVGTDGELRHFQDAMDLCQKHLGYGREFHLR